MPQKAQGSPRFTIVFVLVLLLVSALIFFAFSRYQRDMAEARRQASALNLLRMQKLLDDFAQAHAGRYPQHAAELVARGVKEVELLHPSWPEQPGYIYVTGVNTISDDRDSIVIYENVPERKRKLGFLVLRLNGKTAWLSQYDFAPALSRQQEIWKLKGRVWQTEEILHTSADSIKN